MDVVRGDLKFENILFESKKSDAEIKIIDFGLSKKFKGNEAKSMTRIVGTAYTMSPQVLQGAYDHKSDLWAVGVITYMLLSNTKPFDEKKMILLKKQIFSCKYTFEKPGFNKTSKEAKDFVSSLLVMNPAVRLNAHQALHSKWIISFNHKNSRHASFRTLNRVHDGLQSFSNQTGEFKKIALMVIAHKSSTDDIIKLREAFNTYDVSDDGEITMIEFKSALLSTGNWQSDEEIARIFNKIDIDHTGCINYTEFLAATIERHGRLEEERLTEAFDRIDSDENGYISKEEMRSLLGKNYTSKKAKEIFNSIDTNHDGIISYEEFIQIFRKWKGATQVYSSKDAIVLDDADGCADM